jgi:hypothetical protein
MVQSLLLGFLVFEALTAFECHSIHDNEHTLTIMSQLRKYLCGLLA